MSKHNHTHTRKRLMAAIGAVLAFALLNGCGGPPTEALDAAERTLLDAAWAEDCAAETYRSALKMLDEAKAASEAGDYDEAKRKADAATRLAEQARTDAELGAEECERRKQAMQVLENKYDQDEQTTATARQESSLETIYFDFDQSALSTDAQSNLQHNAAWLLENAASRVRIEGHTDSRGSTEYNLALSQRRAAATKRYLQALGVDAGRLAVVPFGEERPATYGEGETDHARNRRAEFVPY